VAIVMLAVGIATFNGRHLLERTLPSFLNQTLRPDRLIIVDDGSIDGTAEWLKQGWPEVELIRHSQNQGITASLNTCLSAGLDVEFVGLFNNDVELAPTCLAELCSALRNDPSAAASGPKMLNYYDRAVLDGAGDIYCWLGTAHRRGQGDADRGQYDRPEQIFGVCGGAAVYRASALHELGLFDEDLYAYYEDVDWALRANLAGYHCIYQPQAVVYHMGGATGGYGLNRSSAYYCWRNTIWLALKNWRRSDLLRHGWLLVIGQVGNLVVAVKTHMVGVLLRAWRDALTGAPLMLRKRRMRSGTPAKLHLPRIVIGRIWN
jgi:GT2 family glycosyltransferase